MSLIESLEERFGLKVEELNTAEKETFFAALDKVKKTQITPEGWRDYIVQMRESVEQELVDEPEFNRFLIFKFENRRQILLKARLKNYLLIESFLTTYDRAKEQLESMVANMKKPIS